MKAKILQIGKSIFNIPIFISLFPLFYYSLLFTKYWNLVTIEYGLTWLLIFTILNIFIFYFLKRLFKGEKNFSIIYFIVLVFYSFWGKFIFFIKKIKFEENIYEHIFVLFTLCFVCFSCYYFFTKFKNLKLSFYKYLSYLIPIFILIQFITIVINTKKKYEIKQETTYLLTDTIKTLTNKPNIYFLLFDSYPGKKSLKELFNFDNNPFYANLRKLNFYVKDTMHSNYDRTLFTMASMFYGTYIDEKQIKPINKYEFHDKFYNLIYDSPLFNLFGKMGYSVINNSIFDMNGQKNQNEIVLKRNYYLNQFTFFRTIGKDFQKQLANSLFNLNYLNQNRNVSASNNQIVESTKINSNSDYSKFVYSHIYLPHPPMFLDSLGKELSYFENIDDRKNFIPFLKYTNKVILNLSNYLINKDKNAVVIIMSDHGLKDYYNFKDSMNFDTFFAIHLPDSNYKEFEYLKSNINLFPILLNKYFDLKIPIQKDSFFSIHEEANKIEYMDIKIAN